MSFNDFISKNHPDPDSLIYPNYDQLCILAEEYAKSKQLLKTSTAEQEDSFNCYNVKFPGSPHRCKVQCEVCNSK